MDTNVSHSELGHRSKIFQTMLCSNGLIAVNQTNEAVRLKSAGNSPLELTKMMPTELQNGQLRGEVGLLVVLELATYLIPGTAFIEKYIAGIIPKTGLITTNNSSLVTIIDEARCKLLMTISVENATEENRTSTGKQACTFSSITTLPSMSETIVLVKNFAEASN